MAEPVKMVSTKELSAKMGVSPKRARMYLRTRYPGELKYKRWQLTPEQAKKVIRDYKAEMRQRKARKLAIKELEEEDNRSIGDSAVNVEYKGGK